MNKKILFFFLFLLVGILPVVVLAEEGPIENIVSNVVRVVIFVAGAIVIIIWIVTGVLFLASRGDPSKLTLAKSALFAAIAGTILVILAISAQAIISSVIFKGI